MILFSAVLVSVLLSNVFSSGWAGCVFGVVGLGSMTFGSVFQLHTVN